LLLDDASPFITKENHHLFTYNYQILKNKKTNLSGGG